MVIIAQVYILICILFLAGKDATSYLLKDRTTTTKGVIGLTITRLRRWHRDGVILNILFLIPLVFFLGNYWLILYTVLIRLAFFDIAFNKWANIDYRFLGSTAIVDKFFSSVFGQYGAVKKSFVFFVILIILNIFLN